MLSLFELSIEQLKLKEKLKVPALLQEAKPGTDKFEPGTEGSSKVCVCVSFVRLWLLLWMIMVTVWGEWSHTIF